MKKSITLKELKTRALSGENPFEILVSIGYSTAEAEKLFFGLLDNNEYFSA